MPLLLFSWGKWGRDNPLSRQSICFGNLIDKQFHRALVAVMVLKLTNPVLYFFPAAMFKRQTKASKRTLARTVKLGS